MTYSVTSRGQAVILGVGLAVSASWLFGVRSLNAVAMPMLVALLAATVWTWRSNTPSVEVGSVEPGFPGEQRTLPISMSGAETATASVQLPAGVAGKAERSPISSSESTWISLELQERGVYDIGPIRIKRRDPLGLLEHSTAVDGGEIVVYPEPCDLTGRSALEELFAADLIAAGQEFDRLREYTPGDPLRHVHWQTSAKYGDFVVAEYTDEGAPDAITVAGSTHTNDGEQLARTVFAVVEQAFRSGLAVGLAIPGKRLDPGRGEQHRRLVRRALATVGPGPIPQGVADAADVHVHVEQRAGLATPETTTIEVAGRKHPLSAFRSERHEVVP